MTDLNARWIKKDEDSLYADLLTGKLSVKCDPLNAIVKSSNGIKIKTQGITLDLLDDEIKQTTVSPNILSDTKYFRGICNQELNTSKNILTAFNYPWYPVNFINGTVGNGTVKIVTLDYLAPNLIGFQGDLNKAMSISLLGADFRVLILDIHLTNNQTNGDIGGLSLLGQGDYKFTGYNRGEFPIQLSAFVNVISATGDIRLYLLQDIISTHIHITSDLVGEGWKYITANNTKFRKSLKSYFYGLGHMKVAIALPYAGIGFHNKRFIYANSVGRYMFDYDLMPNGYTFKYSQGYYQGINAGNIDGYASNTYDDDTNNLDIEVITGFQTGYKAGFKQGQNQKIIYDNGYSAGNTKGGSDYTNTNPYNDIITNTNTFYQDGYLHGYEDGWTSAGGDSAYNVGNSIGNTNGSTDCTNSNPYNNSVEMLNPNYISGYEVGYLNGWTSSGCSIP